MPLAIGSSARAQQAPAPVGYFSGPNSVYGAPGFYGTSWGIAAYGVTGSPPVIQGNDTLDFIVQVKSVKKGS